MSRAGCEAALIVSSPFFLKAGWRVLASAGKLDWSGVPPAAIEGKFCARPGWKSMQTFHGRGEKRFADFFRLLAFPEFNSLTIQTYFRMLADG
jgi:hypothetical protein